MWEISVEKMETGKSSWFHTENFRTACCYAVIAKSCAFLSLPLFFLHFVQVVYEGLGNSVTRTARCGCVLWPCSGSDPARCGCLLQPSVAFLTLDNLPFSSPDIPWSITCKSWSSFSAPRPVTPFGFISNVILCSVLAMGCKNRGWLVTLMKSCI